MSRSENPIPDALRLDAHDTDAEGRGAVSNPWVNAASRALHPSAGRIELSRSGGPGDPGPETGEEWVWAIASGLAEVTVPWDLRGEESPSPGERHWELALATPEYEVWTIYWPPGTGIDLHDHGSSSGAFCVVAGELIETVVLEGGTVAERGWSRGEGTRFGAGHTHRVVNAGRTTATSVHVYAPPLTTMTYYDGASEVDRSTLRHDAAPREVARSALPASATAAADDRDPT